MDTAVGLVQAYLRMNGFFTVAEYPIIARAHGGSLTLTDVDVLAVWFPAVQRWIPEGNQHGEALPPDPELALTDDCMEMIIGEVKEGRARLNRNAYELPVVETVIRRFGCCAHDPAATARAVVRNGRGDTRVGAGMPCRIRMIVFGGAGEEHHGRYEVISLRHVITFMSRYLSLHRDLYLHTQLKDETLDLMALLVKLDLKL